MVSRSPAETDSLRRAEQWLERLGRTAVRLLSSGEERPTWSGLIDELSLKPPLGSLPLLVDRRALADQGLWSSTKVPALPATMAHENPLTIAVRVLQQGNLALVADPQALLLTSLPLAVVEGEQLQPTGDWPVFLSTSGPLRRQIEAGPLLASNRFISPLVWKAELHPPWLDAEPSEARDNLGWMAYRLESGSSPGTVHVVRRGARSGRLDHVLAHGNLGLVATPSTSRRVIVRGPGVCRRGAAGAPALVPFLAGGVLGTFACLAAGLLIPYRRNTFVPSAARDSVHSTRPAPALIGTAIVMALLVAGRVIAAEPGVPAAAGADAAEIYKVFIPSDEDGKPTGARYQVAEGLITELRRKANEARGRPEGWLLEGAKYQARLVHSNMPAGLEVADLTASFDLQVFDHSAEVRIPLAREGLAILPSSVMLDGRAVDVEWEPSGRAFVCPIAEPGKYRLELSLHPAVRSLGEVSMFELNVPGVPTASLELQVPADVKSVEVPGAWEPAPGPTNIIRRWPIWEPAIGWQCAGRIA